MPFMKLIDGCAKELRDVKFRFDLRWNGDLSRGVKEKIDDACRSLKDASDLYGREKEQADG